MKNIDLNLDLDLDNISDELSTDIDDLDEILGDNSDDESDIDTDREDKIKEAIENRKNNVGETINLNPIVDVINEESNNSDNKSDILVGPDNDPVRTTIEAYKTFDQIAWNKKSGYKLPHFPFMQKKLEGLDEGLYLFAAESNAG